VSISCDSAKVLEGQDAYDAFEKAYSFAGAGGAAGAVEYAAGDVPLVLYALVGVG
jgi:hypothetical protein